MAKSCFNGTYFLILTLLIFFMLLYVYVGGKPNVPKTSFETFEQSYKLIPPEKLVVVQGLGVPDVPIEPSKPDTTDVSAPTIDGSDNGPRSKFYFAYNECRPECCATSGGYSCSGGCPCLSKDQMKFGYSRGFNHRNAKCGFDDEKNM